MQKFLYLKSSLKSALIKDYRVFNTLIEKFFKEVFQEQLYVMRINMFFEGYLCLGDVPFSQYAKEVLQKYL